MPRNCLLLFWKLVGTCLLVSLTGCAQSPVVPASAPLVKQLPAPAVSNSASRFGSFNLHKRHGLGGWQGSAQTSQHQWLQQIQHAKDATNPALPRTVSPGL